MSEREAALEQAADDAAAALAAAADHTQQSLAAQESSLLAAAAADKVGRCRLTLSRPVLKAPMVSALDTIIR